MAHQPMRSGPPAEPTVEAMPQVDLESRGFHRAAALQRDNYYEEPDEPYTGSYDQQFLPGVDVYGIVLGVIAAVALVGLIPLYWAVYQTIVRTITATPQ